MSGENLKLNTEKTTSDLREPQQPQILSHEEIRDLIKKFDKSAQIVQDSNEYYYHLFNLIPEGYVVTNNEGLVVNANPSAEHILGMSSGKLKNKLFSAIVAPESRQILLNHLQLVFATETTQSCQIEIIKDNDTCFHVKLESIQLKSETLALCRTLIKPVASTTTAPELPVHQKNQSIVEQILGTGNWHLDLITNEIKWFDENQIANGPTPEKQLRTIRKALPVFYCENIIEVETIIKNAIKNNVGWKIEYKTLQKNKLEAYTLLTGNAIYDKNRNPVALYGSNQDITERKLMEIELKQQKQFIQAIADVSPSLFYIYNLKTQKINYASKSLSAMLGYSVEEINSVGHNFFKKNIHPNDISPTTEHIKRISKDTYNQVYENIYRLKWKNGDWVWVLSRDVVFSRDKKGNPIQILGNALDITEYEKANKNLSTIESTLRRLHQITADQNIKFDQKITNLLQVGCEKFELSTGILSQVENGVAKVKAAVSPGNAIEKGMLLPLQNSMCSEALKQNKPFSVQDVSESKWGGHRCRTVNKIGAYIGLRVVVNEKVYGILNFSDASSRKTRFTSTDKEILKLMVQWVEAELFQQQVKTITLSTIEDEQEKERERIAADLHDSIGPLLSIIKRNMKSIQDNNGNSHTAASINEVINLIDKTGQELKNITYGLIPNELIDFGLASALQNLISKISQGGEKEINFIGYGDFDENRLERSAELKLYRITQELLNNALKHSQANKIDVQLIKHNESIILMVEDNGIGYDTQKNNSGLGLNNIASRVGLLKGFLSIDSTPGKGTTSIVEIPLN